MSTRTNRCSVTWRAKSMSAPLNNKTTTWRAERARIAGLSARPNRAPDDPELIEARRNLRALRLEEHVERVLADAPPLNDEQRNRIAALLRIGGGVR